MKSRCLIRNATTYGIPGGWTLSHPALPGQAVAGRSPEDAVGTLAAYLRVNGMAATDDQLWEFANEAWGRRVLSAGQAERWMGWPLPERTAVAGKDAVDAAPMLRRVLTPRDTGPVLWGTLHLIPLVFTPAAWLAHLELMTRLITPGGYEPGCDRCAAHWRTFLAANPPARVTDGKAAARWSFDAHNNASSNAGKPLWSWQDAAKKWGWPLEW